MRTSTGKALGLLLAVVLLVALLAGTGMWLADSFKNSLQPRLSLGCTATAGGASHYLALDQSSNAALISGISVQRGMPARAASIALATGMQESRLRNIDYGDLDSVGLFQQRPSQDWGTVEQIMDPVYSANAFYDVLAKVPGYVDLPINDAAQIVQRSGFPEAYAQHEPLARAFASTLTGQTPAGLSCTMEPAAQSGNPDAVMASAQQAFGSLARLTTTAATAESGAVLTFDGAAEHGWMVAQWAVANAHGLEISAVSHAGQTWQRNNNDGGQNLGWQPAAAPSSAGVSITLAGPETAPGG